jgi:hypothetical protein
MRTLARFNSLLLCGSLAVLLTTAGCTPLEPRYQREFRGPTETLGENLRSVGPPGRAAGISKTARDIERNLGVE